MESIRISMCIIPSDRMERQLRITPPVSSTLEEAKAKAPRANPGIGQETLTALCAYLSGEKANRPYTDSQVIAYMRRVGYRIDRRDVAFARTLNSLVE